MFTIDPAKEGFCSNTSGRCLNLGTKVGDGFHSIWWPCGFSIIFATWKWLIPLINKVIDHFGWSIGNTLMLPEVCRATVALKLVRNASFYFYLLYLTEFSTISHLSRTPFVQCRPTQQPLNQPCGYFWWTKSCTTWDDEYPRMLKDIYNMYIYMFTIYQLVLQISSINSITHCLVVTALPDGGWRILPWTFADRLGSTPNWQTTSQPTNQPTNQPTGSMFPYLFRRLHEKKGWVTYLHIYHFKNETIHIVKHTMMIIDSLYVYM